MRACEIRIVLQRTRMHTRVRTHTCVRTHVRGVYVRVRLCGRKRVRKRVCACAACVRAQIHPLAYMSIYLDNYWHSVITQSFLKEHTFETYTRAQGQVDR